MIFEKIELEKDEHVISIIRRHWFFLLAQCFSIFVLGLLPLLGFAALYFAAPEITDTFATVYIPHILFVYAFWLLINWMMLALIWTDHYLDIWAITNRRIIKINQVSLFKRQIGSFRLERLQDLNVEISGLIATILDFGTIHAETASGKSEEFKADYLPHPQKIKATILKAADTRIRPF